MSVKEMLVSVISEENDESVDYPEMTDGGLLMADEDDDLGDLDGLADDEAGRFDDEFGGMDPGDRGSTSTDELEHRLEELENEVQSLSSTVNTVRTENEQISKSVEDVDDNVGKLLDIYEMVTRGVNPFADAVEAGEPSGTNDRSFGLFDEGDTGNEEEELDDELTNLDAEGFFDEELIEDHPDGNQSSSNDLESAFPDGTTEEVESDDSLFDENPDGDDDTDQGTTFQDLKEEYDSGDVGSTMEAEAKVEGGVTVEEETVDVSNDADSAGEETPLNDDIGAEVSRENGEDIDGGSDRELESEPATTDEDTSGSDRTASPVADSPGKPYLATLPAGYPWDLISIGWLEYLLEHVGHREASRAIEYYETIDWIHEDVADDLQEILRGFEDVGGADGGLTIDHHMQSLQYISQLGDSGTDAVVLAELVGSGGSNGLQQ